MKKFTYQLLFYIFLGAFSPVSYVFADKASACAAGFTTGLEFLGLDSSVFCETFYISDLISATYIFGISLVGVSALVALTVAGVWYMTAGDNEGRIRQAREWINNAIFGLVLALLSYLILNTINPALVSTNKLDALPDIAYGCKTAPPTCLAASPVCANGSWTCQPIK